MVEAKSDYIFLSLKELKLKLQLAVRKELRLFFFER